MYGEGAEEPIPAEIKAARRARIIFRASHVPLLPSYRTAHSHSRQPNRSMREQVFTFDNICQFRPMESEIVLYNNMIIVKICATGEVIQLAPRHQLVMIAFDER